MRTVVYPAFSHHIKSLLHIFYDIPKTMSGVYRKKTPIERFMEDIKGVEEEDLYGYRVELQYIGKVCLSLMLRNPALTSAALPENVLCQYLISKHIYINVIYDFYRYVCGRGLFSGGAARAATTTKQLCC